AVVRQIMRTEPPAGLRARVMSQLAAPRRQAVLTMPRLAAGMAFAVCLMAGFVVTRDRTAPSVEPVRTVAVASGVTAPPAAAVPASPAVTPAPAAVALAAEPRQGDAPLAFLVSQTVSRSALPVEDERLVSAMSIDEAPLAVAIGPLRPIPAIMTAPLESSPVLIKEIAIHPLEMDPVRVDPLPSPPR
ncbi:MAG: hypothetical protein ABIX28_17865, partial [Vicinamibacterales bacterium]